MYAVLDEFEIELSAEDGYQFSEVKRNSEDYDVQYDESKKYCADLLQENKDTLEDKVNSEGPKYSRTFVDSDEFSMNLSPNSNRDRRTHDPKIEKFEI